MSTIKKLEGRKWVATFDDGRDSPPMKTKRAAQDWLDEKALDAQLGDEGVRLMSAAIIKGLVEKDSGTAYFGSTMSYTYHYEQAVRFGYVTRNKQVTTRGLEWYNRCLRQLAQKRQIYWNMEGGVGMADPSIRNPETE